MVLMMTQLRNACAADASAPGAFLCGIAVRDRGRVVRAQSASVSQFSGVIVIVVMAMIVIEVVIVIVIVRVIDVDVAIVNVVVHDAPRTGRDGEHEEAARCQCVGEHSGHGKELSNGHATAEDVSILRGGRSHSQCTSFARVCRFAAIAPRGAGKGQLGPHKRPGGALGGALSARQTRQCLPIFLEQT
jgi:hypothetical protein